ncbi:MULTISPECIES: VRR-NUC domain-containing protein [Gammaproteobacteria]|uniref:VRR-NUC domain-containing protein n=1 Tax=Gammaproteobacteria TaxID=1236 RepID=UPI002FC79BC6
MISDKGDYLEFYSPDKTDTYVEEVHQVNSVTYMRVKQPDLLFWHTVNEGKKNITAALRDDQAGLLKGVSDFVIIIGIRPGCRYTFAAIELKRVNKSGKGKASPVSEAQRDFLRKVREKGGFAAVAYGKSEFVKAVEYMLNSINC